MFNREMAVIFVKEITLYDINGEIWKLRKKPNGHIDLSFFGLN